MGISISFGPLLFLIILLKNSLGRQTAVLKLFVNGLLSGLFACMRLNVPAQNNKKETKMFLHAFWTLSHVFYDWFVMWVKPQFGLELRAFVLDEAPPFGSTEALGTYIIDLLCNMLGFTRLAQRNKLGNAFLKWCWKCC